MSAVAPLVLKDRQATPVNHTFTPQGEKDGVWTLEESTGVSVGNSRFTILGRRNANQRWVATLKLAVPVVQNKTENGITTPVSVRTAYAECTFTFEPTSTTQERNDIVGMLADALLPAKTMVNDTLINNQSVY